MVLFTNGAHSAPLEETPMKTPKNATTWFELPVQDLERATRFYEEVIGLAMKRLPAERRPMSMFASDPTGSYGALVKTPERKPSDQGALVFLNTGGELAAAVERVVRHGGAVLAPITDLGEHGRIAIIRDTEGNAVGLHDERR
jgi:predicted enzyme related to lactoylglutathione lyase